MAELPSIDELFGLFHDLADLPIEDLRSRADFQTLAKIRHLIEQTLVDPMFPQSTQIESVSDWLKMLRHNEKEWSLRLADLIISSELPLSLQQTALTKSELIEYANACPWLPFREIAKRQIRDIG